MKRIRMDMAIVAPMSPLWAWRRGGASDAATLHKCYARGVWRERSVAERAFLLARILVTWPTANLAMLAWCTGVNGAATRRRFGKPVWRQVVEQIALAARHSVPPPWYYIFGLWDDAKRSRAHLYINRYETKGGIYRLLRAYFRGSGRALNDKLGFHEVCGKHGLPAPPLVMVLRDGDVVGGERRLPEADLFVKPVKARGGIGAERWAFVGARRYRSSDGRECTEAELLELLGERSREKAQLVQRRLCNHPDLADLGAGALSTARVMTVLNEKGEYEAALAVFRTCVDPSSPVDNFHAGGLVAAVDLGSGELGQASGGGSIGVPKVADMIRCDTHPLSGAPITGRRLPFWSEAKELATRAHAAFPRLAVVGWDIAFTPEGPVVIEGNSGPDVDLMQVGHQAPMGDTRVAAALAYHVRRVHERELPARTGESL